MVFDFRLHVFYTVACRLSFTKAAEELFITQPAITKHIRLLEQQLNTRLFERRGNSIALTESGQILWQYSKKIKVLYDLAAQDIAALAGMNKGQLHIGASTTIAQYVLPGILAAFRKAYPDITLELITGNTEQIEQAMLSSAIDLGFIEGHTKNRQIKYLPFLNDEIVLVVHATHELAKYRELELADLYKASFVMREQGSGTLEIIRLALKKAGLKWQQLAIEQYLDSTEAIKSYLLHSNCLAFISSQAVQTVGADGLFKIIKVKDLQINRPLNAIHLQGEASPLAGLFLKFVSRYNQK
jgi:LysR family transcriptional regulator, transcriptional activator of the cysJI operon